MRFALLGLSLTSAWAQNQPIPLNRESTPYDLARYIDSHPAFDWASVWKAIGIANPPEMSVCKDDCAVDLVTIFKPSQVILLVERLSAATYLRFIENDGRWQYAGAHETVLKNHPARHEIMRLDEKTFLRVSGQGASGSGIDSELEEWLDLSLPGFEPVFSFTVQGTDDRGVGISRSIHAAVNPGLEGKTIELDLEVQFYGLGDLGSATYRATFTRDADQNFSFHNSNPALSAEDFHQLATVDSALSNERLLVYTLPRLKEIAGGPEGESKEWLKSMLGQCKDTPEKRALQALLNGKQ